MNTEERMLQLLVAAGLVSQSKMDETRKLAESFAEHEKLEPFRITTDAPEMAVGDSSPINEENLNDSGGESFDQLTEAQKKLMEVARICAGALPKDYTENHKNIWFAFYAGAAWQEHKFAQQSVYAPPLCVCGEVATINGSWCASCFPDTGRN